MSQNISTTKFIKSVRYAAASAGTTVAMFCVGLPAISATLTASQLNEMLKDPSLKLSATSTIVMGNGPAITVLTEEEAKSSDQNLKIDALFLSKALIEAAPGQIQSVKVLFSQSGKSGRFITIGEHELQDFSKGKISPDKLLSSLRFIDVEPERAPDVAAGARFEQRLLVWNRIKKLKQQGTGIAPFERIFREIETEAQSGDTTKVDERIAYLQSKLSDQEEQIRQARKAASGRGVPAAISSASAGSARSGDAGQAANSGGRDSSFIPSDADRIKRIFTQDSEKWVQEVGQKDRSHGDQLRQLKQQIDREFSDKHDAAAFEKIGSVMRIVKQDLGYDPFRPDGGGDGPRGGGPDQNGRPNGGPGFNGGGPGPNGGPPSDDRGPGGR